MFEVTTIRASVPGRRFQSSPIERAREAWFAGEYGSALAMLDAASLRPAEEVEAALLRGRAHLRLGSPGAALSALDRIDGAMSLDERITLVMLRGTALFRLGQRRTGLAALEEAVALARQGLAHPTVRAESAYYLALAFWSDARVDEADVLLRDALRYARDIVRARVLELFGFIALRRERYTDAASLLGDALASLEAARHEDGAMHASLLQTLSGLAAETMDLGLIDRVHASLDRFAWPATSGEQRFHTLQNVGWGAMLQGRDDDAWGRFSVSLEYAPTAATTVTAHVSLAAAARLCSERQTARRHLSRARGIAEGVAWHDESIDARMGLLELAIESTRAGAGDAVWAFQRYSALPAFGDPLHAWQGDRRITALEHHACGLAAVVEGDRRAARRELRAAASLWEALGYRMRLADACADLSELAGDCSWRDRGAAASRSAPSSWLARRLHAQAATVLGLTDAERRVLRALCEGKRTKQIAAEFGRSEFTIRNQTRRIFAVLGVRTRASVVALCARAGLIERLAP